MRILKKLFGGINLTWPKLLIFAVASGVYTALVSIIPQLKDTSLHTIAVTFEVWILLGIFIIMNSKSNLDAALKSFVFFLISQPLIYLIQVPFYDRGWEIFMYYPYWLKITVLTGRAHLKHTEGGDFREATDRALRQVLRYYLLEFNRDKKNRGMILSVDVNASD